MICEQHSWTSEERDCPYCIVEFPAGKANIIQHQPDQDLPLLVKELNSRVTNLEMIVLESKKATTVSVNPNEFIKQLRGLNPYSSRNDFECYNKCCDKAEKLLNQTRVNLNQ